MKWSLWIGLFVVVISSLPRSIGLIGTFLLRIGSWFGMNYLVRRLNHQNNKTIPDGCSSVGKWKRITNESGWKQYYIISFLYFIFSKHSDNDALTFEYKEKNDESSDDKKIEYNTRKKIKLQVSLEQIEFHSCRWNFVPQQNSIDRKIQTVLSSISWNGWSLKFRMRFFSVDNYAESIDAMPNDDYKTNDETLLLETQISLRINAIELLCILSPSQHRQPIPEAFGRINKQPKILKNNRRGKRLSWLLTKVHPGFHIQGFEITVHSQIKSNNNTNSQLLHNQQDNSIEASINCSSMFTTLKSKTYSLSDDDKNNKNIGLLSFLAQLALTNGIQLRLGKASHPTSSAIIAPEDEKPVDTKILISPRTFSITYYPYDCSAHIAILQPQKTSFSSNTASDKESLSIKCYMNIQYLSEINQLFIPMNKLIVTALSPPASKSTAANMGNKSQLSLATAKKKSPKKKSLISIHHITTDVYIAVQMTIFDDGMFLFQESRKEELKKKMKETNYKKRDHQYLLSLNMGTQLSIQHHRWLDIVKYHNDSHYDGIYDKFDNASCIYQCCSLLKDDNYTSMKSNNHEATKLNIHPTVVNDTKIQMSNIFIQKNNYVSIDQNKIMNKDCFHEYDSGSKDNLFWIDRFNLVLQKSQIFSNPAVKVFDSGSDTERVTNQTHNYLDEDLLFLSTEISIGCLNSSINSRTTHTILSTVATVQEKLKTPLIQSIYFQNRKDNIRNIKKKQSKKKAGYIHIKIQSLNFEVALLPFGKDKLLIEEKLPIAKHTKTLFCENNFANASVYNINIDYVDLIFCLPKPELDTIAIHYVKKGNAIESATMTALDGGEAQAFVKQFDCSISFTPSILLPQIKPTENNSETRNRISTKRVCFFVSCAAGAEATIILSDQRSNPPQKYDESTVPVPSGPKVSLCLHSLIIEDNINNEKIDSENLFSSDGKSTENNILLDCSGGFSLGISTEIYEDSSITTKEEEGIFRTTIINHIKINTRSPTMYVTWSPVFMWFLESLMHRIDSSKNYYQGLFCKNQKKKTKRTLTNIHIVTNSTLIHARAILTKGSIINLVSKELQISIHNSHKLFWKKPNISLKAGKTQISIGRSTFKVLEITSVEFNDTFCLAPDFVIQKYNMKQEGKQKDGVMTDGLGRPVQETFEILLGESVVVRLPHNLHLGEIIDDASKTVKMMFEGMMIGELKVRNTSPKKYQLMDIKLKLSFIDATFLEEVQKPFENRYSHLFKYPDYNTSCTIIDLNETNLGMNGSHEKVMLDRWRLSIVGADILIKRDTPPCVTQRILNELDEDKSHHHKYGPMVQGGEVQIHMKRILSVLHPLTLSTPLASLEDTKISGKLYITPLFENTSGVKGQLETVPVTSHDSKCISSKIFCDSVVSESNVTYREGSPVKNENCPCNYGVQYLTGVIPPKIYFDMNINFENVEGTYGMVLATAIPRLQSIIQRLIPPPRESKNPTKEKLPPLTWWDNLRYQFHGKFKMEFLSFSFRWLLDVPAQYDWSILLTSKKTLISHSVGTFQISMEDMIISVPGSSYHILSFDQPLDETETWQFASTYIGDDTFKERHSLMLVPFLKLQFDFMWNTLFSNNIESSSHHLPYLISHDERDKDGTIKTRELMLDKFHQFRSDGVKLSINLSCTPNSTFATWLALRIDVLPWLTHKNPSFEAPPGNPSQKNEALPRISALKINASLSNLQVGAWLNENDDVNILDSLTRSTGRDTISDGICLIIPKVSVKISTEGKKVELRGPIQAALLDIVDDPWYDETAQNKGIKSYSPRFDKNNQIFWSQQLFGSSDLRKLSYFNENTAKTFFHEVKESLYSQTNDKKLYRSFECLQYWSTQIKDIDYLLVVDQIDIMDESLDNIMLNVCHDMSSGKVIENDSSYDSKLLESKIADTPWTVLVLGLKLLWSIDIRDSVMSIVQDLLFTINFMKVNTRGTPQNMAQNTMKNIPMNDHGEATKTNPNTQSLSNFQDIDKSYVETIAREDDNFGVTLIQAKKEEENSTPEKKLQPISHLDYLLEKPDDSVHEINVNNRVAVSPDGHDVVMETARLTKVRYSGDKRGNANSHRTSKYSRGLHMSESSLSNRSSRENTSKDIIPTLNIHLANPQIQLYSESTGGSVILAIHGAYIEGRKFTKLFTRYSSSKNDKVSAESLLRKTDFEYKLEKMEIYSMRTDVDVTVGLQWLSLNRIKPVQKPLLVRSEKTLSKDHLVFDKSCKNIDSESIDTHGNSSKFRIKTSKYFPENLQQYETREFVVPNLFKKIMDPCTFTTRQEFFRPPIDLTKEELAECLLQSSPLSLEGIYASPSDWAIDHVEILMDELSFFLDSYQFSTTIDLIRNVLLEPPKPPRQRYENSAAKSDETKSDKVDTDGNPDEGKALPFENMIREWFKKTKQYRGKKGKKHIKDAARDILSELEENQMEAFEPSSSRIEYTLSKAKWKINCPDFVDDVEINLTGFKGQHNFSADGSVTSQISLEDIRVSSQKPGPDAIGFFDPTAIVTTVVGVELSPCQRCGCHFDRSQNESNSCIFHPGEFLMIPGEKIAQWTCCQAMWEEAPGCTSRPHTGMELAIALRLESLPRKVDGVTMYKHIEANIYPGVPHTLIIQVTKSLGNLFMTYFIGKSDDNANKGSKNIQLEDNPSLISSNNSSMTATSLINKGNKSAPSGASNKKKILFGTQHTEISFTQNASMTASTDEDITQIDEESKPAWKDEEVRKEILFLKRMRVGDINVNISLAGFGSIVDTSNLGIAVPSFQNAYILGPGNYVGQKYISFAVHHLLKSLASSGFEKMLVKIAGKSSNKSIHSDKNHVEKRGEDIDSKTNEITENKSRSRLLLGLPNNKPDSQSPENKKKKKSRFSKK